MDRYLIIIQSYQSLPKLSSTLHTVILQMNKFPDMDSGYESDDNENESENSDNGEGF